MILNCICLNGFAFQLSMDSTDLVHFVNAQGDFVLKCPRSALMKCILCIQTTLKKSCCPKWILDPIIKIIWALFSPLEATACVLSWKKNENNQNVFQIRYQVSEYRRCLFWQTDYFSSAKYSPKFRVYNSCLPRGHYSFPESSHTQNLKLALFQYSLNIWAKLCFKGQTIMTQEEPTSRKV